MCGIAGRYNYLSGASPEPGILRGMCRLQAHRGPDGEGVHIEGPLGLGHRRLSIIDLTEAGSQPMSYDGGRLWIVFNGEIYNFPSLRRELETRGHRFASRTDTEVVLAAYDEFGIDCLKHLRGMFAFAIWDAEARRLFAARDRLGKKPLNYRLDANGVAFASEARAFLAEPSFVPRPNPAAIFHYLSFGCVPGSLSGFEGVKKLPPAHYLVVEDGRLTVERYWRLRYEPKLAIDESEALALLHDHLRDAVRLRLISDVPLGAFLSGGIDSGTIVALMSEVAGSRVKTFSIGFDEKEYDELEFARLVARRYGTDHHEFVVKPDAVGVLPSLVWHYSEPYADSSAVPTYYLAELTRRYVTVVLNGDAGDENFAGYDRYLASVLAARFDRLPGAIRGPLTRLAPLLPSNGGPKSASARFKRFADALEQPAPRRYASWLYQFSPETKSELCTEAFLETVRGADSVQFLEEAFRDASARSLLDRTLAADVAVYLPDDLLVKVDVATMAHGLEGRSPFLDHVLMEFAAVLPEHLKLRGRTKKYLLRRLADRLLPSELLHRRKMGFAVPIDHWFRGSLKSMAYDVLLDTRAAQRGYFRPSFVKRMLDEHASGARNWHAQLWNLLALELWHQTFIDAPLTAVSGPPRCDIR